MTTHEPFYFGVPLISRTAAADWSRVGTLLAGTLRSVLAQEDRDFRFILAAHEVPECWASLVGADPRFEILPADWPTRAPTEANDDAGAKKWQIRERVRAEGGGLLMYLDADDLIDRHLVAAARSRIGREAVGGVVANGFAVDFRSGRAAPLPGPGELDFEFHEVCGSSTVGRVTCRSDAFEQLGSHHLWTRNAAAKGLPLERLPVIGGYVVNTNENHSERHGRFRDWRHAFNKAVAQRGETLPADLKERLGIPSPA